MLPPAQRKIILSLEEATGGAVESLQNLSGVEKELFESASEFISSLKKAADGSIKPSMENIKLVEKYRLQLDKLLLEGKYYSKVNAFLRSYSGVTTLINEYFSLAIENYSVNETLLKAVLNSSVDTTLETLLESGVQASFREPVIRLLKDNVTGNSSIAALRNALREQVLGLETKPGLLSRHVKQVSSDALEQYKRNYMLSVSNDLQIEHYFYSGSEIGSTRPFCKERVGKYYTKAEVESWASLNWSGKAAGTNKTTIFTTLAGYGCRHSLIPVSKSLYEKRVK